MTCRRRVAGPRRHRCSPAHRDLVWGYWLARESQDRRVEAWAIGYARETAEYYRDVEPSLTFRVYLEGLRDNSRGAWAAAA